MYTQAVLISVLVAISEARFGQEQIPIQAIQNVKGGQSGQAATLAGQSISTLLAAANPCAKLQQADLIVSELGTGADSIAAARGLVAAEQNFNPFVVSIPTFCDDPTLPKTESLRGVVPLVDPAVVGSDKENANQALSLKTPFSAAGLSVAQVIAAHGFTNFTTKGLDGAAGAPGAASGAAAGKDSNAAAAPPPAPTAAAPASPPAASCGGTTLVTVTRSKATSSAAPPPASGSSSSGSSSGSTAGKEGPSDSATIGTFPGFKASSIAGLDFGLCTPTIKFEAGLDNRKDTEFTFQAIDPLVNKGQEEALNPNIITNRICDQLTNVCNANAAAKTACTAAKAKISALGTKDKTTADAWNTALGFAGTNTNPDNAPKAGLIGHA